MVENPKRLIVGRVYCNLFYIFWIEGGGALCCFPQSILTLCFRYQVLISKWISHSELNLKQQEKNGKDLVTEKEEAIEKNERANEKKNEIHEIVCMTFTCWIVYIYI